MAGVFKVHPAHRTTITCDALDVERSTAYLLMSGDFAEEEREKVVYSEGRLDGSVIWSESSLVEIELSILVGGTTVEDVAQNMMVLQTAFSSGDGGYIEYRPIGFGSSIETTWYKYLKSSPPRQVDAEKIHQNLTTDYTFSNLYSFRVKVFALATSNPTVPQNIATASIVNFEGSSSYMTIPESSTKGDGIFPIIGFSEGTFSNPNGLLVHFMRLESAGDGLDYYGGTSSPQKPATVTFSAADGFHASPLQATWFLAFQVQDATRMLFSKSVPIMPYNLNSTEGDWEVRLTGTYLPGFEDQVLTEWEDLAQTATNAWEVHIFGSIDVPPIPFPTTLGLGSMIMDVTINVKEKNLATGDIKIHGLLLSPIGKEGDWIAKFTSTSAVDYLGNYALNAVDGIHYSAQGTQPRNAWVKQGMPIRGGIMPRGRYQLRVLSSIYENYGAGSSLGNTDVDVDGIYYTIYPFSE